MRKKLYEFFKNKERVLDTVNVILGLLMLTALVIFWKTGNKFSMFAIIFAGGAMNLCNGYRYIRQNQRKQLGQSMMLLGVVVLVLGVVVMMI